MRMPAFLLAPVVAVIFLAMIGIGRSVELPSASREFGSATGETKEATMIVDGLRCRGTSNFLVKRLQELPGVVGVTTYVQEHRAVIEYEPVKVDVKGLQKAIEAPLIRQDGTAVRPFTVREIK